MRPQIRERWLELATGQFEHVVVPGTTHRDLLRGTRFTPTLAQHLCDHLDRVISDPVADEPTITPFQRTAENAMSARTGRAA